MNELNSTSPTHRKSVWSEFWRIITNGPEPLEEDVPAAESAPSAGNAPPPSVPPAYEYHIEPLVYLVGHCLSLLLCLVTLWLLMHSPFGNLQLAAAALTWIGLAYCSYRMVQGVRYGSSVRLFSGYLEVRQMGPTNVVTAGEVAYFRELNKQNRSRRRVCLYLRSGQRVLLPSVPDPEILHECLVKHVGIHQAL